jgi:hypothetical protein
MVLKVCSIDSALLPFWRACLRRSPAYCDLRTVSSKESIYLYSQNYNKFVACGKRLPTLSSTTPTRRSSPSTRLNSSTPDTSSASLWPTPTSPNCPRPTTHSRPSPDTGPPLPSRSINPSAIPSKPNTKRQTLPSSPRQCGNPSGEMHPGGQTAYRIRSTTP